MLQSNAGPAAACAGLFVAVGSDHLIIKFQLLHPAGCAWPLRKRVVSFVRLGLCPAR